MIDCESVPHGATSPIFSYPYARSLDALQRLQRDGVMDAWDAVKLAYINPATGGAPTPTMAAFLQLLPKGFEGKPYRQTDGAVFSVVEGHGVAVARRDLARQDQLQPGVQRLRDARLPAQRRVLEDQHTAHRLLGANQLAGAQQVRTHIGIAPVRRRAD